jgi:hypothetical protein
VSNYKIARPQNDVRLRNWDAGRLSQLRLAVSRLETEINRTLGASVAQSDRRKISDQVPFIIDLILSPGYRQIQVDYSAPPGLGGHPFRQLLFYEIQHDDNAGFSNPAVIQTPQTHVVIGGLGIGEQRFVRVRVVNTENVASPWTTNSTSTARGRIIQTDLPVIRNGKRLTHKIGEFQRIFTQEYSPVGGAITLNIQLALANISSNVTVTDQDLVLRRTYRGGPATIQFRWELDTFNDVLNDFITTNLGGRTLLSMRPGKAIAGGESPAPIAFGTFMSPFIRPESGSLIRFRLLAAKVVGSEWKGPEQNQPLTTSDPFLFLGNGKIIEILENF